jgi:hypothetical protein
MDSKKNQAGVSEKADTEEQEEGEEVEERVESTQKKAPKDKKAALSIKEYKAKKADGSIPTKPVPIAGTKNPRRSEKQDSLQLYEVYGVSLHNRDTEAIVIDKYLHWLRLRNKKVVHMNPTGAQSSWNQFISHYKEGPDALAKRINKLIGEAQFYRSHCVNKEDVKGYGPFTGMKHYVDYPAPRVYEYRKTLRDDESYSGESTGYSPVDNPLQGQGHLPVRSRKAPRLVHNPTTSPGTPKYHDSYGGPGSPQQSSAGSQQNQSMERPLSLEDRVTKNWNDLDDLYGWKKNHQESYVTLKNEVQKIHEEVRANRDLRNEIQKLRDLLNSVQQQNLELGKELLQVQKDLFRVQSQSQSGGRA